MAWDKQRTRCIRKTITFSPDEWEEAKRLHRLVEGTIRFKSYGAFARAMLTQGEVRAVLAPVSDPVELRKALNAIGNNVNQIAHQANIARSVSEADIRRVEDGQKQIMALFAEVQHAYREALKDE